MKNNTKLIVDKEINLNDNDLLNTKIYSSSLKDIILNSPTPFNIGLFGEWGSGKSSIIKTTSEELESDKKLKIKFITYDAWKYANDSFRRMFLLELQKGLGFEGKDLYNSFYFNQTSDIKIDKTINWKILFPSIIIGLIIIIVTVFSETLELNTNLTITLQALLTLLLIGLNFFKNIFDELKINIQKPHLFAPEQFEECFNEMIDKSLKNKSIIDKYFKPFSTKFKKLVIVIDNIDRCDKELSYELLTNIKNFLGNRENLIFIIPIDDFALKSHILNGNNPNEKEADEFLRKFFNMTIKIKPFKPLDIFDYTNRINIDNNLNLKPTTIDVISKEYATNPRRVIQFINNLIAELEILKQQFDEEFIKKHESLITKLLIIREEWSNLYKIISKEPHLLKNLKELEEKLKDKLEDEQKSFLRKTNAISNSVDLKIIEQILSNQDNHQSISTELINKLYNIENEKEFIEEYLKDSFNYQNIMKYLIDELEKSINRKIYETSVKDIFEQIIKINKITKIEKSENVKIHGLIENELFNFIKYVENIDLLTTYAHDIYKSNMDYLTKYIIEIIKKEFSDKNKTYKDFETQLLLSTIRSFENKKILIDLQNSFFNLYKNKKLLIKDLELKETQLKYLTNDELIEYIIDSMNSLDDKLYNELHYLSYKGILNDENIISVFIRLNSLYPNFNEKTLDYTIDYIQKITNILINQKHSNRENFEVIKLGKLFESRYYQKKDNYGRAVNEHNDLFHQIKSNNEYVKIVLDFLFEIYKFTLNHVNIVPYCWKIADLNGSHKKLIYKYMIDIRDKTSLSMNPFYDFVLKENEIFEDILEIYSFTFLHEDNGKYLISDENIKKKIESFMDKVTKNSNESELILDFFNKIKEDKRIKEIITNKLVTLKSEDISKFSTEIQELCFEYINENDRIFDYQNNIEFLKLILSKNIPKYRDNILRIIHTKLEKIDNEQIKEALELIKVIENLTIANQRKLKISLREHKNKKEFKEEIKIILDNFRV